MMDTLAIVGVGLLGGSLALAVKERKLARRIIGISRSAESLTIAQQRGMIDEGYLEFPQSLEHATLAVICTPVDSVVPLAITLLERFPKLVVSDVGSTKADIVAAIDRSWTYAKRFVGGHPLAGSEKSGPEHASASLFQNKLMFLTPTDFSSSSTLKLLTDFWQNLGSKVVEINAVEHDTVMAMTSHLPHVASFALAGIITEEHMPYSGTGLRSMTRLAGGDPTMWTAIAMSNRQHLQSGVNQLQQRLARFQQALENGNACELNQLFHEGRKVHHALGS